MKFHLPLPRFQIRIPLLYRYVLGHFLSVLTVSLLAATALFMIVDFFEKVDDFLREDASVLQVASYFLYNLPNVIHLMMPIAILVSVLIAVGRLAQRSEIIAMRSAGVSLFWLATPLICTGAALALLMFVLGETVVPWTNMQAYEILNLDIKKKLEKGRLSRANYWYRDGNTFYGVDFYDSRSSTLYGVRIFEFGPHFILRRHLEADSAEWKGSVIRWVMHGVVEFTYPGGTRTRLSRFSQLPLVVPEEPQDFYNIKLDPKTLSLSRLAVYVQKLQREGAPVSEPLVDLYAKLSFPFVNLIVVLIAFPFALTSGRSGKMTWSFVGGVSVGFGYYIVHAFSTSLGNAELIPPLIAAWNATFLLGAVGVYFMVGAEHS